MGIPVELIRAIDSYLGHRSLRVRMDGAVSKWKQMFAGVSQGSTVFLMSKKL